jgi:hypothetical protein
VTDQSKFYLAEEAFRKALKDMAGVRINQNENPEES